jgi:N-acetyl-gamma-glutamyl-phosphate reductase
MIHVGVVGASGYSGLELLKLLLVHPRVQITKLFGNNSSGKRIDAVHPSLRGMLALTIEEFSPSSLKNIDLLFVALPSGHAMAIVPAALAAGCRVVDLGGDFRLADPSVYRSFYGHEHTAPEFLPHAVYGLSEWNCDDIRSAQLVANPGCYPTSIQLALLPLLKAGLAASLPISIASYSGTSGAGRTAAETMMFTEVNESVRAYKVGKHQHIPEIQQYLRRFGGSEVDFSFVPHLLPVSRGDLYDDLLYGLSKRWGERDRARVRSGVRDLAVCAHCCAGNSGNEGCAAHELLRYRICRGGRSPCSLLDHRQPGERRGRTSNPEYESDVRSSTN